MKYSDPLRKKAWITIRYRTLIKSTEVLAEGKKNIKGRIKEVPSWLESKMRVISALHIFFIYILTNYSCSTLSSLYIWKLLVTLKFTFSFPGCHTLRNHMQINEGGITSPRDIQLWERTCMMMRPHVPFFVRKCAGFNLCLVCIFLGGSIKLLLHENKFYMVGENAYYIVKGVDCDSHDFIHGSFPHAYSVVREMAFCKHFQATFVHHSLAR